MNVFPPPHTALVLPLSHDKLSINSGVAIVTVSKEMELHLTRAGHWAVNIMKYERGKSGLRTYNLHGTCTLVV